MAFLQNIDISIVSQWIVGAAGAVYTGFLLFIITGVLRTKNTKAQAQPSVSVIVPAHNEEAEIGKCLQALLAQDYPEELTELVIVVDRSIDETREIAETFREHDDRVQIITIDHVPDGYSPKKYALSRGIEESTGEIILTTDADCRSGKDWITGMVSHFTEDTGFVAGIVYTKPVGGPASYLAGIDGVVTSIIGAGTTGWNRGIACRGGNFAYRRSVYEEVNGFQGVGIQQVLSGDDDLFLQKAKRKTRYGFRFSTLPETVVQEDIPDNLGDIYRRRRRHIDASKHFNRNVQVGYLAYNVANILIIAGALAMVWTRMLFPVALWAFLVKFLLDTTAGYLILKPVREFRILAILPVWEFYNVFKELFISPLGLFGKIRW
ncbi:MAG: glycosyltransferase [Candidatus Marinimicrobia bacterium]|nr:glycosyltransferase [Candidatus Neomarinimicrobiota bacterium]MCF7829271.1 glycosyltransferase [Candidatus Neomarinimicrobiota bacterium]MCF7881076.1 glycosyltransferase [Candidatus Neomarinimicrobiota bacterium]